MLDGIVVEAIPGEQYEAASLDGAGPISYFGYIVVPHIARAVTVVTRGTSDDSNAFVVEDGDALWLRISRAGSAWAFHASTDGTWWQLLRYFTLGLELVRVGFLAQSPTGAGCAATFDHITFRPGAPENLRDGS